MVRKILIIACCTILILIIFMTQDVYSLNSSYLNQTQIRLNQEIYDIAASVINTKHLSQAYSSAKPIYTSFITTIDPIMLLSISCVEWGGNSSMKYTLSPAIASRHFDSIRLDVSKFHASQASTGFYYATGLYSKFSDRSYKGPLQITMYSFVENATTPVKYAPGEDIPADPYSWIDASDWYAHSYCHYFSRAWNSNYKFKSKYELLGHLSVMMNTGQSYMSSSSSFGSGYAVTTFPWKNASAIFAYMSKITEPKNLKIILDHSDNAFQERVNSYKMGITPSNIQLNMNTAVNSLLHKMDIDLSLYVKPQYLSSIKGKSGNTSVREKLAHPIQTIWAYNQLSKFYSD